MTADQRETLFQTWVEAHKGLIFRVVRAYAADRQQQEELYQDILVQLWLSIPSFRGESKASTWAYKVALNTALTRRRAQDRSRRREVPLVELEERPDSASEPNAQEDRELLERVYGAVRALPEPDRSLIVLSLDGVSYREMAEILGMSESNVGVRLNRVKKRLAESLKGVCQ